jgi:hypothetical protein
LFVIPVFRPAILLDFAYSTAYVAYVAVPASGAGIDGGYYHKRRKRAKTGYG